MNIVRNIYRDTVFKRADETEAVFYFTHKDFENLNCIDFPFLSSDGHTLQGYFIHTKTPLTEDWLFLITVWAQVTPAI